MDKKVTIVFPACDPDDKMLRSVQEIQKFLSDDLQLLVVANGLAGKKCAAVLEQIAAMPHCAVFRHEVNCSKDAALKIAFALLLEENKNNPDFAGCVSADCDKQYPAADIMTGVEMLRNSSDTLILGCRDFSHRDMQRKSRSGSRFTEFIFRKILRLPVSDPQTGLRGIPVKLMEKCLELNSGRFAVEIVMLLISGKCGCKIQEFPVRSAASDSNSGAYPLTVWDVLRICGIVFGFIFGTFISFSFSALSSAVLDISIFSLLYYVVLPDTGKVFLSCFIARACSSLWNFFINRTLVFKAGGGNAPGNGVIKEILKYYLLVILIFSASWLLTAVCEQLIPGAWLAAAKLLIDTLLFCLSYSVQKLLIFKRR